MAKFSCKVYYNSCKYKFNRPWEGDLYLLVDVASTLRSGEPYVKFGRSDHFNLGTVTDTQ